MDLRDGPAPFRVRFLGLVVCLVLVGCAGRAVVTLVPEAAQIGAIEPVLIASTRTFEDGQFTGERFEGLNYAAYDVSIPPIRTAGEVTPVRERNPRVDVERQFVVTEAEQIEGSNRFQSAVARALRDNRGGANDVMLYVHGYNVGFADGLFRTAQIQHDLNVPGVAVHYSWPSAGHPLGYAYDRDSAMFARDGLEQVLRDVAAARPDNIVVVAHSLGSSLTMEALRQLRISGRDDVLARIGGVILMSPDIDIDLFRSQAMRLDPLPQPFVIFTSERDRALRLSASITGQQNRLGNIAELEDVADLDVTLIDVSEFSGGSGDGLNHSTAVTSPAAIQLLRRLSEVNLALEGDAARQVGLLPGTVLTVRNATQVILQPTAP